MTKLKKTIKTSFDALEVMEAQEVA